jgi:Protein of unknown function (DUF3987)
VNWLDTFVAQHSELESPIAFWRWSAIAAISAVVKDSVWLNRQIYNLYPNIYVMLHADSGLKKGPPINAAKQLVKVVNNTKIISGRSSIQGILKDLGIAYTVPGGKVINKSVAFIASSELSSSIVSDPVATTILTDLYDRQYNVGEWRSLLKMETFNLKDPTITMLTATNESMGESFFSKKDFSGGYFARTFIIYENARNQANSLIYPMSHTPNYIQSAEYLKKLSELKGPFQSLGEIAPSDVFHNKKTIRDGRTVYLTDAGLLYDDWYNEFLEIIDTHDVKDDTGTLNRFGDSVLKVAMILSLAKSPDLVISKETMDEAIKLCEKLVGNIRKTTMGQKGMSVSAPLKGMIINELLTRPNHQITRTMLMKKMWMHYTNSAEFDEMMLSFDSAGMIKINSIGNNIVYTMPENQVAELKAFLQGKNKI